MSESLGRLPISGNVLFVTGPIELSITPERGLNSLLSAIGDEVRIAETPEQASAILDENQPDRVISTDLGGLWPAMSRIAEKKGIPFGLINPSLAAKDVANATGVTVYEFPSA